jgi:hypothetical protein
MSNIVIKVEFDGAKELSNMLAAAGVKAPQAIRRAINHTGDKAKTAMARALAKQTGLKVSVTKRALKPLRASDGSATGFVPGKGSLEYVLRCKGGDVSLKYFRPIERGGGVYARPWGVQRFYPGAFMKSGPRGKRILNPKFHGHVMENIAGGAWRGKIKIVRSGVFLAAEMVKGDSAAAFHKVVESDLLPRVRHELLRVLPK